MPLIKRPTSKTVQTEEQAQPVQQPQPAPPQGRNSKGSLFSRILDTASKPGQKIGEFGIGFAKELVKAPAKAASLGKNIEERIEGAVRPDITYEELKQRHEATGVRQGIEKTTEQFAQKTGAEKLGGAAEQVAEFFVPGGAATKTSLLSRVAKFTEKAPKLVQSGANLLTKAAVEGVEQAGRTALQEGEANEEVGTAGILGAGSQVAGKFIQKGLNKLGDAFYSLAVPSTILERGKDIRRQIDVGNAVSETGISLTRKSLAKKIGNKISILGSKLDSAIDSATQSGVGTNFDNIAQAALKHIDEVNLGKEIQASPIDLDDAKVVIQETIEKYKGKFGTEKMGAKELQQLKRDIGSGLVKVFDRNMGAPVKAKALTETKLYGQLDSFLDKNVPGYKQLNEKLAPLLEGRDRLMKKGNYSGVTTDIIAGALIGSTGGSLLEDPEGFIKNAIYGVLLKRGVQSTAARTATGAIFKKVGKAVSDPKFYQWFRQAAKLSEGYEE